MYLNLPFALTAPKDHTHFQDYSVTFKKKYHITQKYMESATLHFYKRILKEAKT